MKMTMRSRSVRIDAGEVVLNGDLILPEIPAGVVLFAHGSGSGRHSSRNRFVAARLNEVGLGTLLIDLLSEEEERIDAERGHLRFDIGLLADRLDAAVRWLDMDPETQGQRLGLFGASTGGGAALVEASRRPEDISAVVSRGGRPDMAGDALPHVTAPTLLLVGSLDQVVLDLNRQALSRMDGERHQLVVIPGASHLFEEPGKLEVVAQMAADWFERHLAPG